MRPGTCGGEPRDGCSDRLSPRLQLPEVARGEDDAALDCRLAKACDQHLPDDDRSDHPGRDDSLANEHHECGEHENLVRDRVEE